MPEDFTAHIPESLQWADDLLTKFGRWATSRGGPATCGSAEGEYRAPARGEDDQRRAPAPTALSSQDALRVHRTLQHVPMQERVVLRILYVPQRLPIGAQLRILRLPARMCRERHAAGLRMFANLHRVTA